jgi:two-component system, NtrC family, nitrogen regulation response regulator NtrX
MTDEILIIDDEADIRDLVAGLLEDEGYRTRTDGTAEGALRLIAERPPHLVFLDIWLQGSAMDGLQVLTKIKEQWPDLPVVMISGHGNIETAVSAIRAGAYDFIEKPFKADRLILVAQRALETSHLKRTVRDLKTRVLEGTEILGDSPLIHQLRTAVAKAAPNNARVFLTGAPGSGKELVARQIHALSPRANAPFVVVSAASLPEEEADARLFGFEGNGSVRIGAFEQAHGGTLYLDDVTDMPPSTQTRLLKALSEPAFSRVNGTARVEVDVRVMASTSRAVDIELMDGRFRQDLYYRLNVVPIAVPSLRDRPEDIALLSDFFMQQIAQRTGLPLCPLTQEAENVLRTYDWPGNVRQLRNALERLMILKSTHESRFIQADDLPADLCTKLPTMPTGVGSERILALPLREAREMFERDYLLAQVARFSGHISKTAEFVGMERSALHRKLKALTNISD